MLGGRDGESWYTATTHSIQGSKKCPGLSWPVSQPCCPITAHPLRCFQEKPLRGGREEPGACPSQEALSQTQPSRPAWRGPGTDVQAQVPGGPHAMPTLGQHGFEPCPRVPRGSAEDRGATRSSPRQPWPGLCRATWYSRTILQPEGPRGQPARDRHVPWEHLCAQVQTLPLPWAASTRGQQRWGKKPAKIPGTNHPGCVLRCHARSQMLCHTIPCTQGLGREGKITASL